MRAAHERVAIVDVYDAAVQHPIGDQDASGLDLGKFRHLFVLPPILTAVMSIFVLPPKLTAVMSIRDLVARAHAAGGATALFRCSRWVC